MQLDRHELDTPKSPQARRIRIQRLNDQQHFHYPFVEIGIVEVSVLRLETIDEQPQCLFRIQSNENSWEFFRTYAEIARFDSQLHRCVFERRYSKLEELDFLDNADRTQVEAVMKQYAARLSQLTGSLMTCYPVLKFLEMDCRGNHFEPAEETAINVPAIAAAVVTKAFQSPDAGHLQLKVGDILSIIEMSNAVQSDTNFWKAKRTISAFRDPDQRTGFEVGYFPSDCVRLIDDKDLPSPFASKRKMPNGVGRSVTDIVLNRVQRKRPVFGVDLSVHLQRSGRLVPLIVERCCEAIEQLGIVTGIYRQCGIVSNIQKLRSKFDAGNEPDLVLFGKRDIYSVSSLLKQYFRQLPKPLFSFEGHEAILLAYEKIEQDGGELMKEAVKKLPAAHYRCAQFLMKHLGRLCEFTHLTDMTAKNLAIVWAPNLFRSPSRSDAEPHLLTGLNVHTAVCHYLISHAQEVFSDDIPHEKCDLINSQVPRTTSISKSATVSDIRSEGDSRWPNFFRGRSIETFWKFGSGRTTASAGNTPILNDKNDWRRSQSTDTSAHQSRADSMLSFMARRVDGFRGGMRSLRERARSLRPTSRSNAPVRSRFCYDFPANSTHRQSDNSVMQNSITASTTTQYSEDSVQRPVSLLVPRNDSDQPSSEGSPSTRDSLRERRVVFSQGEDGVSADEEDDTVASLERPLCERSSPVEEWSSDSRDSPQLEMSRYDNVSPSGTLTRAHRDRVSSTFPASVLYNKLQIP